MKALITAAGLGTRLGKLTKNTNKCLLKVGGKPLLMHLVETLNNQSINQIYIVTGHCSEQVKGALGNKAKYFLNSNYASTSLLSSILLAKEELIGSDFLVMTGDSLMHPKILKSFLETKGQVLASVELKKCDEEDFKATIKDNKIINMSKEIPLQEAAGEFTALIKISKEASQAFFEEIEEFIKEGGQKKYIADIVLLLQKKGFEVKPAYTGGLPRIEIDFPEDLRRAEKIYKGFSNF